MQWHYQGGSDAWQRVATPENPAVEAVMANRETITVPFNCLYLDLQSTLESVYRFEPLPAKLPADRGRLILGPHAAAWNLPPSGLDRRVFPRLFALAEIAWSPRESRDWQDFVRRLEGHQRGSGSKYR